VVAGDGHGGLAVPGCISRHRKQPPSSSGARTLRTSDLRYL
jgi:hypothetical protein